MNITGQESIFHQKKVVGRNLRKMFRQLLLMFCMLKKENYILLIFQNITKIKKKKLFF